MTKKFVRSDYDDLMQELEKVKPWRPVIKWKPHHDKFILDARDKYGHSFPTITKILNSKGLVVAKESVRSRYDLLKRG
ncbi:MAG: hypothetical protein ACYSR9_08555 [Planctomycetota bacterium]|jgi:hypothetical protein